MKILTCFIFLFLATIQCPQNQKQKSMLDWKYPYAVKQIQLPENINLAYVDEGNGTQTLVFLHGLGSNLKSWSPNIDSLRNDYRCIAVDLPGYGKSSKEVYTFKMTFFAKTIRHFIDKLQLKNVVLVGHSMGGQIAIHLALKGHPEIKKLVLSAPAGFETFTQEESRWFSENYTAEFIKATPEPQIVKNFEINFYNMPDDARFMIEDRLSMRQSAEYDYYCNMIPKCTMGMLHEPVFANLHNIKYPTLIIYGKNDYLIPNKFLHPTLTTEDIAGNGHEKIPDAQLVLIPEAGHFVHWEKSKNWNEAVVDFVK